MVVALHCTSLIYMMCQILSTFGGPCVYMQRGYPADSYFRSFQVTPYAHYHGRILVPTLCSEKTPTHIFFHISTSDV